MKEFSGPSWRKYVPAEATAMAATGAKKPARKRHLLESWLIAGNVRGRR
jgi:hypothetical protein